MDIVSGDQEINSVAHYTTDGNYLRDVWDPLNRETIYDYDTEIGLYYLPSRYYAPNADYLSYIEKMKEHAIFTTSYTLESAQ